MSGSKVNINFAVRSKNETIIFKDPRKTLALMEGTYITGLRTGAASGVATKYLARKDSRVAGVIGTGAQARTQIWAVCEVLKNIERVKAYDLFPESAEKFSKDMSEKLKLDIEVTKTSRECVENSGVTFCYDIKGSSFGRRLGKKRISYKFDWMDGN